MISNLATVSLSLNALGPLPVPATRRTTDQAKQKRPTSGTLYDGSIAHDMGGPVPRPAERGRKSTGGRALAPNDGDLHVFDLYPHEQEEDLAVHHVAQMVPGLVVLELDVQAIFDAHLPDAQARVQCARSPQVGFPVRSHAPPF